MSLNTIHASTKGHTKRKRKIQLNVSVLKGFLIRLSFYNVRFDFDGSWPENDVTR